MLIAEVRNLTETVELDGAQGRSLPAILGLRDTGASMYKTDTRIFNPGAKFITI
jgi:hypothetical protein